MNKHIVLLGPTASGKTRLATRLAYELNGEVISVDSRQLYRKMDIGTGKDLKEYLVEGRSIPYHLIDIADPGEHFNVHRFQVMARKAVEAIQNAGKQVILCGGTGLYLEALLKDFKYTAVPLNPELRIELEKLTDYELKERLDSLLTDYSEYADTTTRKRLIRAVEISTFLKFNLNFTRSAGGDVPDYLVFGLNPPVELRRERISARLKERMSKGLVEEVSGLLDSGLSAEQLVYYGLEYKYVTFYLLGTLSYRELFTRLETEIHRFAKRQMTYFRKMERGGIEIHWLQAPSDPNLQLEEIMTFLTANRSSND